MSELYPPWSGAGKIFYPPKPFSKAPGVLPPLLALRWGKSRGVALGEGYAYPVPPLDPRSLGATAWYRADLEWAAALWEDQIDDDPNKDLVQAAGGAQPTRTASDPAFGNQSTINFAGAQNMASIAWASALVQPSTMFVVGRDDGVANTQFYADGISGGAREELFKSAAAGGYKIAAVTVLASGVAISTTPKIFVAEFNGANGRVYISSPTARAVGAAVCFVGFSTFAGKPVVNLHDLAVLPSHRGRGIGSLLLAEVERHARERGACKVTLEVHDTNHGAKRLYEATGFGPWRGHTLFVTKRL
jgi:ribosomal protein S18 acetylase RimI-like enzyme